MFFWQILVWRQRVNIYLFVSRYALVFATMATEEPGGTRGGNIRRLRAIVDMVPKQGISVKLFRNLYNFRQSLLYNTLCESTS